MEFQSTTVAPGQVGGLNPPPQGRSVTDAANAVRHADSLLQQALRTGDTTSENARQDLDSSHVRAVLSAETALAHAEMHADTLALGQLLADSYTLATHSGSVLTKPARIASVGSGAPRYSVVNKSEMTVRLIGTTAIVTGRTHDAGVNRGSPFDAQLRFTDVWERHGDAWQLAASQKTLVPTR